MNSRYSRIAVVEETFECLAAHDCDGFGSLLSSDVERVGPFGERRIEVFWRDPRTTEGG